MNDLVAISSGELVARIAPLGAELWSLTDRSGAEWMTDADPAFWTGRAPVLFPVVGALADSEYRLGERRYAMGKHGFARTALFEVIAHGGDTATFRLTDSAATRAVYPFAFALEMAFRLEGTALAMTATVHNSGAEELPFSFGFHPAFAWPLPGSTDKTAHRVTFAEDESQPVRRIDPPSGLVLPQSQPTPVQGCSFAPAATLFEPDALIWDQLASRSLTYGVAGGPALDIAFPDTAMLGIWQKPGAQYLCIEPWAGIADPLGFAGDLRDKPGIMSLAPGARRAFRMTVTVRPAAGVPA